MFVHVLVSLQPFLFDPAEKNKHKFMVQTLFAPDGDVNLEQLWKEIGPEQLMDSKLKCVFEMPVEQNESQEEPAKASPKAPVVQSVPNNAIDPELQKAAEEVRFWGFRFSLSTNDNKIIAFVFIFYIVRCELFF